MVKGAKLTAEHKKRISESMKLAWKKYDWSERNKKVSIAVTGRTWSEEMKRVISQGMMGKKNNYYEDRSMLKPAQYRNNSTYAEWRRNVWLRDKWSCKIANQDCKGRIEAHHILSWREYPELRYKINNGITLCHAHHPRKRAEEKRLEPLFMGLVAVSND